MSLPLSYVFNSDGVHRMLEQKEFNSTGMIFQFMCSFPYRDTAGREDGEVTTVSSLYSVLVVLTYATF